MQAVRIVLAVAAIMSLVSVSASAIESDQKSALEQLGWSEEDGAYFSACFNLFNEHGPKGVPERRISDLCGCKTDKLKDNTNYQLALKSLRQRKVEVDYYFLEMLSGLASVETEPDEPDWETTLAKLDPSLEIMVRNIWDASGDCFIEDEQMR